MNVVWSRSSMIKMQRTTTYSAVLLVDRESFYLYTHIMIGEALQMLFYLKQ
jgi:hypothetical protein